MPSWVYFDASALVKRYTAETGTTFLNDVFKGIPPDRLMCSVLGFLEVVSIIVRKKNDSRINHDEFEQAMNELWAEVIEDDRFFLDSVDDSLVLTSPALILKHNINATDAVLLRSVLKIREGLLETEEGNDLLLLASDKRLVRAAASEGIPVMNPETDRWPPGGPPPG